MIDAGEGEILSGEEIRDLLREDETLDSALAPARDAEGAASRPVLLVSRRADEIELFRLRLEHHGAAVTVVRNPFTALDQLRRARFDGLVTDLSLWANEGDLLFSRIRQMTRPVPVVVVAEGARRGEPAGRRLKLAGAWSVVFRPLRPAEVEQAAVGLLEAAAQTDACQASGADSEGAPPGGGVNLQARPAEVAWLRFFLDARRGSRHVPQAVQLEQLAKAALERLEPRAVGVFLQQGGATVSWLCGEAGELPEDLLRGLLEAAAAGPGDLAVRARSEGGGAAIFLRDLPAAVRGEAPAFIDDLEDLLRSAVGA